MVDNIDDNTGISLADLADFDVSEISEIRFSNLPAGIYDFKTLSGELVEGVNKDDEKRFIVEWKFEVIECKAVLEKGVNKEDLVGRNHSEKQYIVPAKAEEGIGLIRAMIADMGCNNVGGLKSIIDGAVGNIFTGKIVAQPDRNDKSIIYARLKLDPAKK